VNLVTHSVDVICSLCFCLHCQVWHTALLSNTPSQVMAEMFQSWQEENPGKSVRKFAKPSVTELPGWLDAHIPNIEKNYPGFFEQWKQAVKHGNQALSQMSAAGLAKRQVGYKLKNFEYVSPFSAHDPSCTLISPVPPAVPAFPVPSNGFTKQFGYDPITNTVLGHLRCWGK